MLFYTKKLAKDEEYTLALHSAEVPNHLRMSIEVDNNNLLNERMKSDDAYMEFITQLISKIEIVEPIYGTLFKITNISGWFI